MAGRVVTHKSVEHLFAKNPKISVTTDDSVYKGNSQMMKVLRTVSEGFKNAAKDAGFKDEAEFQSYAKNVIRQEVWEERYGAGNA